MNKFLIVNTGSASKKYALFEGEKELIRVHLEKVAEGFWCNLTVGERMDKMEIPLSDYENSVEFALNKIIENGIISAKEEISSIGIRVVAPRDYFSENRKVDDDFVSKLQEVKEEVPLHVKPIFAEIENLRKNFPAVDIIAISDSAFHKDLPAKARLYALPLKISKDLGIYKYGFHGISIKSILAKLEKQLGNLPERIIVCHLGGGSSITAIKNGKSIDTSMGFTPLEGVPMATRIGDTDPGIVINLYRRLNLSPDDLGSFLNNECGLKGLSGKSADLRELLKAEKEGDRDSKTAVEILSYKIQKYIGSYFTALGGLDMLVFSGTIGEYSFILRSKICAGLDCLGISLDNDKNNQTEGVDGFIESNDSKIKIAVVKTDEMAELAKEISTFII